MKVGPSWVFRTVNSPEPKPLEQEGNPSSHGDNPPLTKKRPLSSLEPGSDNKEAHRKRAKGHYGQKIIRTTPTPASRSSCPGGGSGPQPIRSPYAAEEEMRHGDDGLRSPTPSNATSAGSSSSSSGLSIVTLKASSGPHGELGGAPINTGRDTRSEGLEHVPDTWQYGWAGKITSRVQTSEDTEIEEGRCLAYSI